MAKKTGLEHAWHEALVRSLYSRLCVGGKAFIQISKIGLSS